MMPTLFPFLSPKKVFKLEAEDFKASHVQLIGTITEQDIVRLPEPVIRYLKRCGFVGTKKSSFAEIQFSYSSIKMQSNKKWMKLKTHQYNFVGEPKRIAYMKAMIMGFIPFEGRDKYSNGNGHMLGVIGKMIKVFDEKQPEIAKGAAIVLLAEALLVPTYALQDYVIWEPVDALTAKARFVHKGVDIGGTFHFNEQGEYLRFTTNERPFSKPDGSFENFSYTIEIRSYQQQGGLLIAKEVAAIWNLPEGDFEYWLGTIKGINFYQ